MRSNFAQYPTIHSVTYLVMLQNVRQTVCQSWTTGWWFVLLDRPFMWAFRRQRCIDRKFETPAEKKFNETINS